MFRVGRDATLRGPMAKFFSESQAADLCAEAAAQEGEAILVAAGSGWAPHEALGRARAALAGRREDASTHSFLWVTDFPLFERNAEGGSGSRSHPLPSRLGPPRPHTHPPLPDCRTQS